MSDEQTMDRLCDAASAEFGSVIVQRIREMELSLNDLRNLKRDDINSEFNDLKFTQRKKLWLFFERQQESLGGRTFDGNHELPRQENLAANRPSEASHTAQPNVAPPPYSPSPEPRSDGNRGGRGGTTNVRVGQATGSNVAGGNITSTTYNTPRNAEYGSPRTEQRSTGRILRSNSASHHEGETPPKKNKYNIKMDGAQGVAIGDSSKVQGNKFNSRN